jgi:hypothetical protein
MHTCMHACMQLHAGARTHCQGLLAVAPAGCHVGDEVGVAGAALHARAVLTSHDAAGDYLPLKMQQGAGLALLTNAMASEQHLQGSHHHVMSRPHMYTA